MLRRFTLLRRFALSLLLALATAVQAKAMDYDEARQRAWFITDKMAYELNLTPEQYDRAYEINLDYLMSLRTASDCYGSYWSYRDSDLRCVLFDWQYQLYSTIEYFYRPVCWLRTSWYFPIIERYRVGSYFYDRPGIYITYTGRGWRRRSHNDPSPYAGMRPMPGHGMRDGYAARGGAPGNPGGRRDNGFRPDFGNGRNGNRAGQPYNNNGTPRANTGNRGGQAPGSFGNTTRSGRNTNSNANAQNGSGNSNSGSFRPWTGNGGNSNGGNSNGNASTSRPGRGTTTNNGTITRPGRGNTGTAGGTTNRQGGSSQGNGGTTYRPASQRVDNSRQMQRGSSTPGVSTQSRGRVTRTATPSTSSAPSVQKSSRSSSAPSGQGGFSAPSRGTRIGSR